ncbi:hypothetical protein H7846_13310 [Edaphobacter sp. 4G125]|nr:hypothetical protein H7846_13310 [Edaphobacter sp. 4G125]
MTLDEFKAAREQELSGALLALWWGAQGNWDRAHEVAQEIEDPNGSWVHAYLHRKEGDSGNAAYWYRRAGRRTAQGDLDYEWSAIVEALLAKG